MNTTKNVVVGLFQTRAGALQAIEALISAGYEPDVVSLVLSEPAQSQRKATGTTGDAMAIGAGVGAVVGGLVAVSVASVSGLLASGPLLIALSGGTAGAVGGGAVGASSGSGDVAGALRRAGVPTGRAEYYERQLGSGRVLVAVETHGGDDTRRAEGVLSVAGDSVADAADVHAETTLA